MEMDSFEFIHSKLLKVVKEAELTGDDSMGKIKEIWHENKFQLPLKDIVEFINACEAADMSDHLLTLYWLLFHGLVSNHEKISIACINACSRIADIGCLHHVLRILDQYKATKNTPSLSKVLENQSGLVKLSAALERSNFTTGREVHLDFILQKLNYWLIWTQGRLRYPISQEEISKMLSFYSDILLKDNYVNADSVIQVRNIIIYLLNLLNKSAQNDYVLKLVKRVGEPSECGMQFRILEILKKLVIRGRANMIRNALDRSILVNLTKVVLKCQEKDVLNVALQLIVLLYEAPKYFSDHKMLKRDDDFLTFLAENIHKYKWCKIILRFLLFNDSKNDYLRHKVLSLKSNIEITDINAYEELLVTAEGASKFKHKCKLFNFTTSFKLFFFIAFFLTDTIVDIINSVIGFVSGEQMLLSGLLLFFSLLPLPVCNYISLNHFYSTTPLSEQVALEGHTPFYPFMRYLLPWRFDSARHVTYNLLTVLQLHPVVTAVDCLCHVPQPLHKLHHAQYNLAKLKMLIGLLENIPCLTIKIIRVLPSLQDGSYEWNLAFIVNLVGIVWSVISLSKSAVDFETNCRTVDLGNFQIELVSQKLSIFLGFLTMISSKTIVFFILYSMTVNKTWILVLVLCLHLSATFLTHLFTFAEILERDESTERHYIFLRNFNFALLPFVFSELFLIHLRHPIEFLGRYSYYKYKRSFRYFATLYTLHGAEIAALIIVVTSSHYQNRHAVFFVCGWVAVVLYIISGISFVLYQKVFLPEVVGLTCSSEDYDEDNCHNDSCLREYPNTGYKTRVYKFLRSPIETSHAMIVEVIHGRSSEAPSL